MKPLKLSFKGLGSFVQQQEIDFEELSKGMFGIFGKTGSGKTTILDAILLALYGKITKGTDQQDFISIKSDACSVRLSFEAQSDRRSRKFFVSREYRRGRDRISSTAIFGEILQLGEKVLASGVREVDEYIKEIVGLSYSEFSKCIALPQGEFAAFLNSSVSERTEIISNIFSLSEYGEKLLEKVKERKAVAEREVETLSAKREMLQIVTSQELEELSEKIKALEAQNAALESQRGEKSKEILERKEVLMNLKRAAEISKKLENLLMQKQIYKEKGIALEKARRANTIAPELKKLAELEGEVKKLKFETEEALKVKVEKENRYNSFIQSEESFDKNFATKIVELNNQEAKLVSAIECQRMVMSLEGEKESLIEDQEKAEEVLQAQAKREAENYANIEKIKEKIDALKAEIVELQSNSEAKELLHRAGELRSRISTYESIEKQVENLIDKTSEKIKQQTKKREKLTLVLGEIDGELKGLGSSLSELMYESKSDNQNRLQNLGEEFVRMVEVDNRLEFVQGEIDRLSRQRSELRERLETEESEKIKLEEEYLAARRAADEGRDSSSIRQSDFLNMCSEKALIALERAKVRAEFDEKQISELGARISEFEKVKDRLYLSFVDNNSARVENFKELFENTRAEVERLKLLFKKQETRRLEMLDLKLRQVEVGAIISSAKEHESELLELLYNLQKYRGESELILLSVGQQLEGRKIEENTEDFSSLLKNRNEQLSKLQDLLANFLTIGSQISREVSEQRAHLKSMNEKIENLKLTIADKKQSYLGAMSPSQSLSQSLIKVREQIRDDNEHFKYNIERRDKLKSEFDKALSGYSIKQSLLDSTAAKLSEFSFNLNTTLFDLGFSSALEAKSYFFEKEELLKREEEITSYNNSISSSRSELESLREKLSGKEEDEESVKKLESEINDLSVKLREGQFMLGTYASEFKRLKEDKEKADEIDSKLPALAKDLDNAKELLSVLRGKALVQYIAEEYMQNITESAKGKLSMLLGSRFDLSYENQEFFVYDNLMGHIKRPVKTLSGGETFLVSLALALGISEIISFSSEKSMEFFFLDEGFGTLDSELVESVISALYKLESHNLKIGLISHVKELEERVKNKILVTKSEDGSGSFIEIVHNL